MQPPSVSVVWPGRVCIKCPEAAFRFDALTIHHVRHTFIGHALVGGRILAAVRDAAGAQRGHHEPLTQWVRSARLDRRSLPPTVRSLRHILPCGVGFQLAMPAVPKLL